MSAINNWTNLINSLSPAESTLKNYVFSKLLLKINQFLRPHQKNDEFFDLTIVKKNHVEMFNTFKLTYEQLLIENDATDIFVDMSSLSSNNNIIFNMVGVGKWIKFHGGNASRIFFFDEEKTLISDKSMADFLNKLDDIRSQYKFFGKAPVVYYKFRSLPSIDIIEYLQKFNVITFEFSKQTPIVEQPRNFENKVLLDQTMMLTLCSDLSYGFSESFYKSPEDKSKEIMIKNRQDLETYLLNKEILVNQYAYEQTKIKVDYMGGPKEKIRFDELCKKINIVPNEKNPRFHYLKDIELLCASVAESKCAIIITGNQRLCNKIDSYYRELPYKLFFGAQLTESKYI